MDAVWWIVGFILPMTIAPLCEEMNWAGAWLGRWLGFAIADVWWGLRLVWDTNLLRESVWVRRRSSRSPSLYWQLEMDEMAVLRGVSEKALSDIASADNVHADLAKWCECRNCRIYRK